MRTQYYWVRPILCLQLIAVLLIFLGVIMQLDATLAVLVLYRLTRSSIRSGTASAPTTARLAEVGAFCPYLQPLGDTSGQRWLSMVFLCRPRMCSGAYGTRKQESLLRLKNGRSAPDEIDQCLEMAAGRW